MAKESTTLAVAPDRPRASEALANLIGMDSSAMLEVIRAQCFKGQATDSQVAAFVVVAAEMRLNPLLPGLLYAYPASGGSIIPIIGPDGVYKKLGEHADIDSWEVEVFPDSGAPTHAIAKIYRKSTTRPVSYRADFSEWRVQSNPNWGTRPRHMLGLRALKQAARQIIHALPGDEDDRAIMEQRGEIIVSPPTTATTTTGGGTVLVERADGTKLRKGGKKEAAIDVPATPAETPAATQEPAKAEKPADAPAQPATPAKGKRTTLEKGEKLTIRPAAIISAVVEDLGGPGKPGCIADIRSPQYEGKVYDMAGAHMVAGPDGVKAQLLPVWANGAGVALEVEGRGSKAHGVIVLVTKVTPIAPQEEKPKAEDQETQGLGLEA